MSTFDNQSKINLDATEETCDLLVNVFNACGELLENTEVLDDDGFPDGYKVPSDYYIENLLNLFEEMKKLQQKHDV
jgi:hypothetical protein